MLAVQMSRLLKTIAPTNLVSEHGLVHLERRLGAVGLDASNVVREAARQRSAQGVHLQIDGEVVRQTCTYVSVGEVGRHGLGYLGLGRASKKL